MSQTQNIPKSQEDWSKLPELNVPSLQSEANDGAIYTAEKVGFVPLLAPGEYDPSEAPPALPTMQVDGVLHRLPKELGSWAYDCVAHAHVGILQFPCKVELGVLNERAYAEFPLE